MLKVEKKIKVVNRVQFLTGGDLTSETGAERCDAVIGTGTLHASAPVGTWNDSVIKVKILSSTSGRIPSL